MKHLGGDTLEFTVNLDNIEYGKFKLTLASNIPLGDIESDQEVVLTKNDDYTIEMQIDKNSIDFNQVILKYTVPTTMQAGDKIEFNATVTNLENEEETQTKDIEINIVEKNTNDNTPNTDNTNNSNNQEQFLNNNNSAFSEMNQNMEMQSISLQNVSGQSQSSFSQSLVQGNSSQTIGNTTVYNGSNNNYLSSLSIENYTLNKNFTKENSTYFVEIDSSVDSLSITATAEDSASTVCVYGNENLKSGTNKILITVTAEDGTTRSYRIYVEK